MDERVKRALEQWPNVPDVYGWLSLDLRGRWLLRGEQISNEKLVHFINRNYIRLDDGGYAFQNGPQKVHVSLAYLPYVLHIDTHGDWQLHSQEAMNKPIAAYVDDEGRFVIESLQQVALLIDQDASTLLMQVRDATGLAPNDAELLQALEQKMPTNWQLNTPAGLVPLHHLNSAEVAQKFNIIQQPQAR